MTKQPTALGGDIFAGLFTLGVKRAGFNVLGVIEHTKYGHATSAANFPAIGYRCGIESWRAEDYTGQVDFMYCNPPCAAWSAMRVGDNKDWREHKDRLQYVDNLTTAGITIAPKVWAWESVTNAWRHGSEFVLGQSQRWMEAGYHVTILLQNNKFIGGTQHRPRIFVIAHQTQLVWQPFTAPPTVRELLKIAATFKAVGAQAPLKANPLPKSLEILWHEAPHHGHVLRRALLAHPDQETLRPRPAMTVNRLKLDETPGVWIGASKRLHPTKPRHLDWWEMMALVGMPHDWKTRATSFEAASLELSRAVMPGVGEWLARSVRAGLGRRLNSEPFVRLVDLQHPSLPREEDLTGHPALMPWRLDLPDAVKPPLKAAPKAARATPDGAPRVTRPGSGLRIRELLRAGRSTDEILTVIHREFPGSKATKADVSWNKRKIFLEEGVRV